VRVVFRSSAEGKKIKHFSKYWGVINTGRPLQVKYWAVATPAALTPMLAAILFRPKEMPL